MNCKDFNENLALYLYEELPSEQRAAYESHVNACGSCRAALDRARRLAYLLRQRPAAEPSPELLVQCRQALDEALEREELGWHGLIARWLGGVHPVPASRSIPALALLILGFGLGWTLRSRPVGVPLGPQGISSASSAGDLENVRIKDITRVAPDPETGDVHITFDAERRMTLEGSLDDPRIEQLLVNAVRNYRNPGIRRDTLDALRPHRDSPNIRQALLYAMRHDPNAGIRLEALKDVQAMEWSPEVRQAFLETLKRDTNPGVRVAAINALTQHADREALPVLQEVATTDANRYIRIKCATAVQELGGK
jgi:hypothetical protein